MHFSLPTAWNGKPCGGFDSAAAKMQLRHRHRGATPRRSTKGGTHAAAAARLVMWSANAEVDVNQKAHKLIRPILAALLALSLAITGCGQSAGGVDIWDAVARGDGMAIHRFASAGGDLNVRGSGGSTPLWVALKEKNRDSYEALLKHGADPNVIMSGKRVVTHWAALEEDPWWLRLALEHEADPNLVNIGRGRPSEGTPLQFALGKRSQLTLEDDLRGGGKFLDNIKLLVQHGADIDKPDRYKCYRLRRLRITMTLTASYACLKQAPITRSHNLAGSVSLHVFVK